MLRISIKTRPNFATQQKMSTAYVLMNILWQLAQIRRVAPRSNADRLYRN